MKKLLALLSGFIVASSSSSLVVSCGSKTASPVEDAAKNDDELLEGLNNLDLGQIDNLKPLKSANDNNEFNWDLTHTDKKVINNKWNDFGFADDQIGYYELANLYFSKVDKLKYLNVQNKDFKWNDSTYKAWVGFKFSLKNIQGKKYVLKVSSYSKNVDITFESNQKIQQTLDSVINGNNVLHVSDGSKYEILNKLSTRLSKENGKIDWKNNLDINNRLFERVKGQVGYDHTVDIDNETGKGTIEIFFKGSNTNSFGSVVTQKIQIDNYNKLGFDYKGNPYYYYDDRTKEQINALNKIDSSVNKLNKDKHVIILGLDGVRKDKFRKDVLDKNDKNFFQSFYSQPWESVYGWKSLLSGSISGQTNSIFKMAKDSGLSTYANTMWGSFKTRIFTQTSKESGQKNIDESFNQNSDLAYKDLTEDGNDWINKDYTKTAANNFKDQALGEDGFNKAIEQYKNGNKMKPSSIEDTLPKDDIKTTDKDLINLNSLKSYASYENFLDTIKTSGSNSLPNLSFQYDTLEDNEGHSAGSYDNFYSSSLYKETMKAYKYELNDLFKQYGKDDNTMIIVTTDHGRDEKDSSHQGFDLQPRESWFYSNKDLTKFENKNYQVNEYSLKEIIYNFLSK